MHESIARHAAAATFQSRIIVGAEFDFELVEFILRNAVLLNLANNGIKLGKRSVAGVLGLVQNLRYHLRWAVVTEDIVDAAIDFDGDLLFKDEVAIHAASAASMKRLIKQGHRIPFTGPARWNRITNSHRRQRTEFFFDLAAALLGLFWFMRIGEWWWGPRGNVAEIFLGEGEAFVGLHVAEDQQYGVV